MKKHLFVISFLAISMFSCDKEEEMPSLFLEGSYESIFQTSEDAPGISTVMTFTKTGNLLTEHFVTAVGSDVRCLQAYSEGSYTLTGEDFTSTLSSSFGPDPAAFDISAGCIPKSQLVNNLNPNYRVLSGTLVFDETKEEYILGFPCKDMIEALSTCIGPQTYTKVD